MVFSFDSFWTLLNGRWFSESVELWVLNGSLFSTVQPLISLLRMCRNVRAGKNVRPQQQCKGTAWLSGLRNTRNSSSSQSRGMTYEKGLRDCPHDKCSKIIQPYTRNGSPLEERTIIASDHHGLQTLPREVF